MGLRIRAQGQALLGEPLTIYQGPEDELRYGGSDVRGLHYEAFLAADNEEVAETLPALDRPRYLSLPDLPTRIAELAHKWTDSIRSPYQKAKAIEEHLRTEYRYDVSSPSGAAKQPLDDFLFVSRRGHCEFFSTAMAIMLRDVGIPSRNVTGFVGGTYNRFGRYYAVREGDAHSWVEGYIDDLAHPTWVTFDPTPPAGAQPLEATTGLWVYIRDLIEAWSQGWNRYVLNYDLRQQIHLFESFSNRYEKFRKEARRRQRPAQQGDARARRRGDSPRCLRGGLHGLEATPHECPGRRPSSKGSPRPERRDGDDALPRARGSSRPKWDHAPRVASSAATRRRPPCAKTPTRGRSRRSTTTVYLEARFGGSRLDEGTRRDFERRVKGIRAWRRHSEALATNV